MRSFVAPAVVPHRTSDATRAGASRVRPATARPPIDCATTCARSMPRCVEQRNEVRPEHEPPDAHFAGRPAPATRVVNGATELAREHRDLLPPGKVITTRAVQENHVRPLAMLFEVQVRPVHIGKRHTRSLNRERGAGNRAVLPVAPLTDAEGRVHQSNGPRLPVPCSLFPVTGARAGASRACAPRGQAQG